MAKSKAEKEGLPEEMIIEILYRLPPKTIGQFRCVSKKWNNFLSDPKFTKTHFTIHAHKQYEQKLILADYGLLYTFTLTQKPQNELIDAESDKLNFHQFRNRFMSVDGSCNGLVLVGTYEKIQFLVNPTTLKYHEIPKFDMALPEEESKCIYGFGYDVVSDDYKVVCLSYYDPDEPDTFDTFVDVYSVRKGLWRRLENSPYDHSCPEHVAPGVLVNVALHWVTSKTSPYSCVIAAFDLTDEKFLEVPPPIDQLSILGTELVALRGRLCVFIKGGVDTITLFLMEDYGVKDSWTLFKITILSLEDTICTPLCSMTDDDIVMDADRKLIVYNMKENTVWDPFIDAGDAMYKARTFMDSLVSPSYGFGTKG